MLGEASILVTNNGNHPTAKYAMAAAARIVNDLHADDPIQEARTQIKIAEVLEKHHENVRQDIHGQLAGDAASVLAPYAMDVVQVIVKEIIAAVEGTPWFQHFKDHAESYLAPTVHQFLDAQVQGDKLWHCDANPDCEHAQAYKAAQTQAAE